MASSLFVLLAFLGTITLPSPSPLIPPPATPAALAGTSSSLQQDAAANAGESSRVTGIGPDATDTFIDTALIGRHQADLVNHWIVFVSNAHPEGIWARIKAFDPTTGTVTLYAPVAAGWVKPNDTYWFGDDAIDNHDGIVKQTTILDRPPIDIPPLVPGVPQPWNAATNLAPEAVALDTNGGADTITNNGTIAATAEAFVPSISIPGTQEGKSATDLSTTAKSVATAIDSGNDMDRVVNAAAITATGSATAAGVGVSISSAPTGDGKGTSTVKGDITASGESTGIAGGPGADTIQNTANTSATAVATTVKADVGVVGAKGDSAVSASTRATSQAAGINGGAGGDVITSSGALAASADSTAVGLDVSVGKAEGKDNTVKTATTGGATAAATATGINADGSGTSTDWNVALVNDDSGIGVRYTDRQTHDSGNDSVITGGTVTATATATTVGVGIGVAVDGEAAAASVSKAEANATAVDLGGGSDLLTNTGALDVGASATGVGLNVSVGVASGGESAKAAADGSVSAEANASGVSADSRETETSHALSVIVSAGTFTIEAGDAVTHASGHDVVENTGLIEANASATTVAAGIGVSVGAKANAKTTSSAKAGAMGVDLGAGNDTLTNSGAVTSNADATAVSLNAAVGVGSESKDSKSKSSSAADGSATATARATGLDADGGPADTSRTAVLTIGGDGLSVAYSSSTTKSQGNDSVTNNGLVSAEADATTVAVGLGITVKGAASANSLSTTDAAAVAIDLGAGQDTLTNAGALNADSDSNAVGFKAAVSTDGRATSSDGWWHGGVKATAQSADVDAVGAGNRGTNASVVVDSSGIRASYGTTTGNIDSGSDHVSNSGTLVSDAEANAIAANVSVSLDGVAAGVSHVEANADATGLRTGNGTDEIRNLGAGTTTVDADATAVGAKIVFSGKGAAIAGDALWDGAIKATANATGIDADSGQTNNSLITGSIDANGVQIVRRAIATSASGNDLIVNEQAITADATATAPSVGVALEAKKGLAAVVSKTTADSNAAAIRAGGGADQVTNSGALESTATSTAVAANIAIAKDGLAVATSSVWDGGTTANATAIGIDADGGSANSTTTTTLTVNGSGASIVHSTITDQTQGDDIVVNSGRVSASSTATAPSVDVALTVKGLSAALSQATTHAAAEAIRGGGGNDAITNTGALTADADATSVAVTVSVAVDKGAAVAANAVWNGGITADAKAIGIDADGGDAHSTSTLTITTSGGGDIDNQSSTTAAEGNDTIINSGQIEAMADAITPQVGVAVAVKGVAAAISTATARASTTAIETGGGDDAVTNTAALHADSGAVGVAVNIAAGDKGIAAAANDVWDGGVDATATAHGINGGDGADAVVNDGGIVADSSATTVSAAIAAVATGIPVAVSTATANASGVAIDGGAGNDTITNSDHGLGHTGKLVADVDAVAVTANVAVTNTGVAAAADAVWDGGTTGAASAKGIDAGAGADTIANTAAIEAHANSVPVSVAVGVAVTGVTAASATSNASSKAAAIDSGLDADVVNNGGALLAEATTTAVGASVTFTNAGVAVGADSVWDGGTTANSNARGITTGNGGDQVTNDGTINTDATATTVSGNVSVSVQGLAGAVSSSTANTNSTAIETGDGRDTIDNRRANDVQTGALISTADSTAVAAAVSVAVYGVAVSADAVWDGGTTATAAANGIDSGTGADAVTNSAAIGVEADSTTVSAGIGVGVFGVAGAVVNATGDSAATAITTGNDDSADTVTNSGALSATADTNAVSAGISFSVAGLAVSGDAAWDGGTTATTNATGIATGGGADTVTNSAAITTISDADAVSAQVGVTVFGVAGGISSSTALARSAAIDGGSGNDVIENTGAGTLNVSSDANGVAVNVTATGIGVAASADAVWDTGTRADANSRGISAGAGGDTITNDAQITANATSSTTSVAVTLTGTGAGLAVATSTSTADAAAIDGGDDADTVTNRHDLTANAHASGTGVAVTVTGLGGGGGGDAFWNGGTTATAIATGLAGGGGDDSVTNDGATVRANATSETTSVTVSVTAFGLAGAAAGSTSTASATAIDGGAGDDQIVNDARLVPNATSTGKGVSVTFNLAGSAASGPVVDNATTAAAFATGIAGGGDTDQVTATATSSIDLHASAETKDTAVSVSVVGVSLADSDALSWASGTGIHGGDGNDTLTNDGTITAAAAGGATPAAINATSKARAITVTIAGDAEGTATGTAEADAIGIDGGNQNDTILNNGSISLAPAASAVGQTVGVSVAGTTITDARGVAGFSAVGLEGGTGNDTVTNEGTITLTPTSSATGRAVNVTVAGAAIGDASAVSTGWAAGLDGGSGDDVVTNRDTLTTNVTSATTAKSTGVVVAGSSLGASNTVSIPFAIGLEGGAGADIVTNSASGRLTVTSSAATVAESVKISVFGSATGSAMTTPDARATGMDGGAEADSLTNSGRIDVNAISSALSTASTTEIFGSAQSSGGTTATATAIGADGGSGADNLLNRSVINATGAATATVDGSSWVLGGSSNDQSVLEALGYALGMTGGDGSDVLRNEGNVRATGTGTLRATGGADAIFGNASVDTRLSGHAQAVGLAGDAGADDITNELSVDVDATAQVTAAKVAVSFLAVDDVPTTTAALAARTEASGVDGGAGNDVLRNNATLDVHANALATGTGGAETTFGGTQAIATIDADSAVAGMRGGAGSDVVVNTGQMTVDATSDAQVTNSADSGFVWGDADTRSDANGLATASGLSADLGSSALTNSGVATIQATGIGFGLSYASGAHLTFDADGKAVAASTASSTASGFTVGDGNNSVTNSGTMGVSAFARTSKPLELTFGEVWTQEVVIEHICHDETDEDGNTTQVCVDTPKTVTTKHPLTITLGVTPTNAIANGNGLDGDGTAEAFATGSATAYGVHAGNGANTITNTGLLSVAARPTPSAGVFADGDAWGDAKGTTTATATAHATGILAGDGGNTVQNDGTLTVTAAPLANARTEVSGGDICIWYIFGTWCGGGGKGYATATTSYTAEAVGVRTGTGDDTVINNGTLTVTAAPADGATAAAIVGADVAAWSNTITSTAAGIQTGNGNDTVVNTGTLTVHAGDVLAGAACQLGWCAADQVSAIGIDTGAGNDVIENDGSLTVTTERRGHTAEGVAIDAGAGNDRITVGSDSVTTGSILLGSGDDAFVLSAGAAWSSNPDPGPGTDTFVLGGNRDGSFDMADLGTKFAGFERHGKIGSSTWTLLGDRHADWTVTDGTLVVPGTIIGTFTTDGRGEIALRSTGAITGDAGAPAIVLDGGGALTNDGSVRATGDGPAVMLGGSGSAVTSTGTIGGGVGVAVTGSGTLLRNLGVIQASAAGILVTGNANALVNGGGIESSGIGMAIGGADTVVSNTGTIRGSAGVVVTGQNSILSNTGLVEATGNAPAVRIDGIANHLLNDGVLLGVDAGLIIGGSGNSAVNSGTVTSGGTGVGLEGSDNSFVNGGTINPGVNAAAVDVTGANNVVVNAGALAAPGLLIDVRGTSHHLTNTGTMETAGVAIRLAGQGDSLVNAGAIDAGAALQIVGSGHSLVNGGLINAATTAVDIHGDAIAVRNGGSIAAQGLAIDVTGHGAILTNDGTILSGGSTAVRLTGDDHTLVNRGLIDAIGPAVRLQSAAEAVTTVENDTMGLVRSATDVAILGGAGDERVTNAGWVRGGAGQAIDLGAGNDLLMLTTTSIIEGVAHGGTGTDQLVLAGTGGALLDVGQFTGFESLTKKDVSRWFVTGASDTPWRVGSGELSVLGTLSGNGVVEPGGRLSGLGHVGAFVNGGTVAPGLSIGTLTAAGDYQQNAGAVLEIEGTPLTGVSDHLQVAGHATLNGGTVVALPGDATYGIATEYTILHAEAGVQGTFEGAISTASNLDATLEYLPDDVSLLLIRNDISFAAMGTGANGLAFGTAMDANKRAMAHGDFKTLMDNFVGIDETAQRAALQTLTGELHATVARSLVHTGMRFFSAEMTRQLSARTLRTGTRAFWADAFGFNGSVDGDGNASGANYRATGFATGLDVMATDATRVGIGFGISPGHTELDRVNGGVASTQSYHPSIYGEHDTSTWDLGGGFGYSRHLVDTSRHVAVGSIGRLATAHYGADQYSTLVRGGVAFARLRTASLKAFSELRYGRLTRGGFVETGAGSANLNDGSGNTVESLEFLLGVHTTWNGETSRVRPDLRVGWTHESLDQRGAFTGAIAGATADGFKAFSIFGPAEARNGAMLSLGLFVGLGKAGDAYIYYDGRGSTTGIENGFAAGGRLRW